MAVQEVVSVLRTLLQDNGETLRARHGAEVVAAVQDIERLLSKRLQQESAYASLWDRFKENPQGLAMQLTGALEAMVEADPALARRLDAFVREYHEVIAPPDVEQAQTGNEVMAVGGDVLDTALKPVEVAEEENRGPYAPDTASDTRFNASVERGTYLYGNVKGGKEDVGRAVGVEVFDFGRRAEIVNLVDVRGVGRLFEQLTRAVSEHPAIDDALKKEVVAELQSAESQVRQTEDADSAILAQHLHKLQEMAPDIADILLNALSTADLGPAVQRAVEQVQGSTEE